MSQPPGMRFIRSHIRAQHYRLTKHVTTVRLERGITIAEMEQALLNGEIIERYPDAQPYPACLVLGWLTLILYILSVREEMLSRPYALSRCTSRKTSYGKAIIKLKG